LSEHFHRLVAEGVLHVFLGLVSLFRDGGIIRLIFNVDVVISLYLVAVVVRLFLPGACVCSRCWTERGVKQSEQTKYKMMIIKI
jgi:hypothetical protein